MNQQAHLLPLQRTARHLARQLTALQLRCHSVTYAQRLSELVDQILTPIAQRIDELEVVSAGTTLNDLLEQANRCTTALLALLATCSNALTAAELAPMLSPTIRLLTEAEHMAWGTKA
ncbi:hypothetical protein [Aeromonas aquatica]|uniref:hypothetical protein n=1 Tax=Aeromonas aquatica TaxID=558964 RepID=UPI00286EC849|nr:hypothetical protein [Aeromonas aquatica]